MTLFLQTQNVTSMRDIRAQFTMTLHIRFVEFIDFRCCKTEYVNCYTCSYLLCSWYRPICIWLLLWYI